MQFNLITQPWLTAKNRHGDVNNYSLGSCFEQAHQLTGFVHANPLVVASWQRLMLAVLHRVYPSHTASQWRQLYSTGSFQSEVIDYLNAQTDKFDLFSARHPFFQIPQLSKDKASSIKKLSPDFATGNNKTLFSHLADDQAFFLSYAEAASYVLVCQYFSLGGGNSGSSNVFGKHSNYTNAPLVGGAVVYAKGRNLFESLLLNFHKATALSGNEDKPIWEQDLPTTLQPRVCTGMADYFTWPARYIRLIPDFDGNVSTLYIAQGLPNPAEVLFEPFFAYKRRKDNKEYPMRLSFGKALWRESAAIFYRSTVEVEQKNDIRPQSICNIQRYAEELQSQSKMSLSCEVIALDNNKANPLAWFHQRLPLHITCILDDGEQEQPYAWLLNDAVSFTERAFYTLKKSLRAYVSICMPAGARTEDVTKVLESYQIDKFYWPKRDQDFLPFFDALVSAQEAEIDQVIINWKSQCLLDVITVFDELMRLHIKGSGRELQAFAKAKNTLESELWSFIKNNALDPEKIFTNQRECKVSVNVTEFVDYLKSLTIKSNPNREALAHLRRALSDEPSAQLAAMPYIAAYMPVGEWPLRVYILVAALYASHQNHVHTYENLGASLVKLVKPNKQPSASLALRVKTLLEADEETLASSLRSLFQLLKGAEILVDYIVLTEDLLVWQSDKKTTQLTWARSFWAAPKKHQPQTTNEQGE